MSPDDAEAIREEFREMIETRNRLTIRQDWLGKGVVMRFPVNDKTIEVAHDTLVEIVGLTAPYLDSPSWKVDGWYSTPNPNHRLRSILESFAID